MKKFIAIIALLMNFNYGVFSDNSIGSEVSPKPIPVVMPKTILQIFDDLDRILCRQIIYMSSIDNKDAIKGDNIKYSLTLYLKNLPKEQKEHIKALVVKQMDSMDDKGIKYDLEERSFAEKHPVDLSILMMMYFNHYGLNELDSALYDEETITILQNIINRFKDQK